ncbi:hypothetical protein E5676_scaffold108G00450 [Cucumis melo var. makuwa]|uniref:Uncharacterized protein n=1 Tax=Cucumis melo var. makuwa TaxID=1194695 RepID=A0A5D3C4E7_CUCMM|nr:hypothetical protein E5676_scaffold108G00450 [Cucumis melo var. makuwa]
MDAIVEDEVHELMIFLNSPGASFQSDLVTAWLSYHISILMGNNCNSLHEFNPMEVMLKKEVRNFGKDGASSLKHIEKEKDVV